MARIIKAFVYKAQDGWNLCTRQNPLMNFIFKSKRDAYNSARCLRWKATRLKEWDRK